MAAYSAVRRLRARHRLALTGTPLENHLGELWAQFDFLMPGFLGDVRSFQRHWRKPIEVNGETLRAEALARRVRPFILRRRKEDVATELPPVTEVIRRVPLAGQQRTLYESVRVSADHLVRRVLVKNGLARSQISVLGALLKLRQVCCDPFLVKGTKVLATMERAKLALLCEMLPALVADGHRVIVFSQFTEMLGLIGPALERLESFLRFHIQTSLERPEAVFLSYMELRSLTPENRRDIAELRRRYEDMLEAILIAGEAQGSMSVPDSRLTTMALIAMLTGVTNWYREGGRLDQDKVVAIYWDLVRGAVAA